jgi:nucleoside-diphosphate-sugar epimerase
MARSALVTGASGFIGRHLVGRLAADGWDVVSLGRRDPRIVGTRFIPAAIDGDLAAALCGLHVNAVFHLAAYGVAPGDRDPVRTFAVNVAGTAALVRTAAAVDAEAMVYVGSCSEYADAEPGRLILESHPITTRLYGASKAAGGIWGQAAAKQAKIGFSHMRLFGVYGPGEAPHRLLPSIAQRVRQGRSVDLSPGEQIRDMVHVDDAVEGLLRAEILARRGDVAAFNLCSGRPVSVKTFALAIADAFGARRDLLHFGAISVRPDDVMWLAGDGTAFTKATGFVPQLTLEAGLARTMTVIDTGTGL